VSVRRIVDGDQVQQAVISTMRTEDRVLDHLAVIERDRGLDPGRLPAPRSWDTVLDLRAAPDEGNYPRIIVVCPGLDGTPERDEEGYYRAPFGVVVAAVVSARDDASTERLARRYIAAIRDLLLKHSTLDGFADASFWEDERYDALGGDDTRALAVGSLDFTVWVPDVACDMAPPPPKAYTPPPDPAVAETVIVHTEPREDL
jgi:hypothetical protein